MACREFQLPDAGQHRIDGGRGHHEPVGSLGCGTFRQHRCMSSHCIAMQSNSVLVQLEAQVNALASELGLLSHSHDRMLKELCERGSADHGASSICSGPNQFRVFWRTLRCETTQRSCCIGIQATGSCFFCVACPYLQSRITYH